MMIRNMASLFAFRNGTHLGRFAVVAVFLFVFVSGAWGACQTETYNCNSSFGRPKQCGRNTETTICVVNSSFGICNKEPSDGGNLLQTCREFSGYISECTVNSCNSSTVNYSCLVCGNQCDLDSIACVNDGKEWGLVSGGTCNGKGCIDCDEQCQCEEQGMIWTGTECIEDTTMCNPYRSQCAGLGGEFIGEVKSVNGEKCCVASCNTCGTSAMKRVQDLKISSCCARGQYADSTVMCYTNYLREGCGMAFSSNIPQDDKESFCRDPNLDDEAASIYAQQCSVEQSSSSIEPGGGSSSSEGGGTSSEGGNSSGGEYGDCQECPWLDSILDTLHSIHYTIDDIKTCMQVPGACPGFDFSVDFSEMPVFGFDTAFRKYLKPLMDSSLKVDSLQLKALLKLDTNQLKLLKADSALLKNDTVTWTKFDALGNVIDTSVHSQNDTTRKWFKRIADSIGVSTDSLAAHIDSIIRHIPDSVLDSIVKYQQYATDNFDSVLFGHGKGFSLVDSLIDSSVKYFKESNQKWNEYISMYGDSMQKIHEEFIDLPGRNGSAIGSVLGYGDTASTNLRGDLNGIREAIEGLGDGIGSGVAGALDSAIGSGSGADTAGVGYGWLADGDALADSIKAASGYNSLDFEADSALRDSLENAGYVCTDSTCCVGNQCVEFDSEKKIQDSLARFVAAYGDTLQQKNSEFLADSVDGMFQAVKDSLNVWNPVGIFDSTVLSTLGMKIPNTNTCPEHCSKFEVDIPFMFGTQHFTIDYGLCLGRAAFANGNVLSFLRFIIRIVVAFTCISAVMWNAARIKR